MQINWTNTGLDGLKRIRDYIAEYDPDAAKQVLTGIISAIDQLSSFPKLGKKYPPRDDENIRQLIHGKYRIIYVIDESVTRRSFTSHFGHSSRLLPGLHRCASTQALARSWPHACSSGADRRHSIVRRDIHRPDRQDE